jgi:hypothetical protein
VKQGHLTKKKKKRERENDSPIFGCKCKLYLEITFSKETFLSKECRKTRALEGGRIA